MVKAGEVMYNGDNGSDGAVRKLKIFLASSFCPVHALIMTKTNGTSEVRSSKSTATRVLDAISSVRDGQRVANGLCHDDAVAAAFAALQSSLGN
jgi:hypothetical protein